MAPDPFFSVIIPVYNRQSFIEKAIRSVLNQTFEDFEIIVIDDGSTDDTERAVKSIESDKLRYIKKKNEERGIARNTGAEQARGRYVNFFDSDDLLLPNHLQEAYSFIKRTNSAEVYHFAYEFRSEHGKLIERRNRFRGDINKKLIHGNLLSCNGVFIRKDIAQLHPFRPDRALAASEDYELWLRLAARYKIHHSNIVTSVIVNHEGRSTIAYDIAKLIERIELLEKYIWEDPEIRKVYSKYKNVQRSDTKSYIALYLTLSGRPIGEVVLYLRKSFLLSPFTLLSRRRFYAILKHLTMRLWKKY